MKNNVVVLDYVCIDNYKLMLVDDQDDTYTYNIYKHIFLWFWKSIDTFQGEDKVEVYKRALDKFRKLTTEDV